MAQAAIDAIDAVKGGKISNWSTGTNNNKKAKTLLALFQIKAAGAFHSITSEDSANLQKVRDTYSTIIEEANLQFEGLRWLYCGDEYFTHYNPSDQDPSYIGLKNPPPTVAEQQKACAQYGGWYDGGFNWFVSKKANEQRSDIFCKANTGAFTISTFSSITWCPNAFNGFSNGHKYLPSIGGVKSNQNSQIKKDDPLKNFESLASTWVHEWTHLQSNTNDQPAYDGKGNAIANSKTYGFFACVNLAKKDKALAVANADTYAYFAMAMYLDQWNWSSGLAADRFGM